MRTFIDMFNEAKSAEEIKRSPPLPAGDYVIEVTKANPEAKLKFDFGDYKEGTQCLEIFFKPVEAVDVDEDDLALCEEWRSKVLSMRIVGADDAHKFFDVKNNRGLVIDAGLTPGDYFDDEGPDLKMLCSDLKGCQVLATIIHKENQKDPENPYVNIQSTASSA